VEVIGYNSDMKNHSKDLEKFISDIENKNIKQNEIVVSNVKENIVEFVKNKGLDFKTTDIKLNVRRYKHLLRDYKKNKNKTIEIDDVLNINKHLTNPYAVYFDNLDKHRNLLYIFKKEENLFKIVVALNGEIITAGRINENDLKNKYYEKIR